VETFEELGGDVLGFAFAGDAEGEVLVRDLVDLLLEVREREREAGNYDLGDDIRDDLETLGIEVQDTDEGPSYRL
jgi:cysteinyl-tRNA synthetase